MEVYFFADMLKDVVFVSLHGRGQSTCDDYYDIACHVRGHDGWTHYFHDLNIAKAYGELLVSYGYTYKISIILNVI